MSELNSIKLSHGKEHWTEDWPYNELSELCCTRCKTPFFGSKKREECKECLESSKNIKE